MTEFIDEFREFCLKDTPFNNFYRSFRRAQKQLRETEEQVKINGEQEYPQAVRVAKREVLNFRKEIERRTPPLFNEFIVAKICDTPISVSESVDRSNAIRQDSKDLTATLDIGRGEPVIVEGDIEVVGKEGPAGIKPEGSPDKS